MSSDGMIAWLVPNPRRVARNALLVAGGAAALAVLAGRGLSLVLALPEGADLARPRVEEVASAGHARASAARETRPALSRRAYLDPILKRNIFDSAAVGLSSTASEEVGEAGRRTDLNATLLATLVAEPEQFSSALISSSEGGGGVQGYGIGDRLLGEAEIIRIEQKKVILRRSDGSVEYLDMEGAGSLRNSRATADAAEPGEEGVTKTDENSYVVDASLVEGALSNIDELVTQVRATPHRGSDGEIDGYRLSAIRRGSLLQKLGIKNGDIVHSVNGMALTDASGAMGAFQALQSEQSFSFEVTRRNQKQTFSYEIR